MRLSWRNHLTAVLGAALFLAAGPAAALETPALEELETLLRDLGFDPGKVDGVVDDDTIAAIRRYQDFALLPGEPEPSEKLLNELRGVAAAFAALSTSGRDANDGKEEPPTSAPAPDTGEAESQPTPVAEKVVVPPPPAPPKLKPLEEAGTEAAEAEEAMEEKQQLAELPPATTPDPAPPADSVAPEAAPEQPAAVVPPTAEGAPAGPEEAEPLDSAAAQAARIEAELAPFRADLTAGRITPEALAHRFNDLGRRALQNSQYDEAILKFSVAIHLFPDFAGAYSNRGTAYQRNEETDLAAADFAKAKELGFGGFRLKDGKKPFQ